MRLRLVFLLALLTSFDACTRQGKIDRALKQGSQYFEAGELEKSKITYLNVLRSDPANASAIRYLGIIWYEEGSPIAAIPYLRKAEENDAKDREIHRRLANAYLGLRQITEARKEAEETLKLDATQPDALLLLAETSPSKAETQATRERLLQLDATKPGVALALAALALHENDLPASEAKLGSAIAAAPNLALAHSARGAAALQRNDTAAAEEEFKTAATLAPRSSASATYAELLARRDRKAAQEYLKTLADKHPDFIPAWILQSRMALEDKAPDQAVPYIQRALQIDPANFDALLLLGDVHLIKAETDKAIDLFKRLNESPIYAGVPLVKFELARAYLQKSNPSQAMAALAEAVKLQPDYRDAALLLGQLKLQQGDPQAVVDSMKGVLKKTPNFLPAHLLLSQAYRSEGNLADAARVLVEQIEATPNLSEPHLLLGLIRLQEKKRTEARQEFEAVQKLAPTNLLAAYHLVEMDLGDKSFEAALERSQEIATRLPASPGPLYLQARVRLAQEQLQAAEDLLNKSIQMDSNFVAAYELLVSIYVKAGELDAAGAQMEAFLARNPENTGALVTLGSIQERAKRIPEARETYAKAIAANPNSIAALNNLAVIYAETNHDLDKAYELASRARTLAAEDGAVADTLGWIAFRRQQYPQALSLLQESAGKLPGRPEIQYHLGMAHYMLGHAEAAKEALAKAVSALEAFPGKDEIPQSLAVLEGGAKPGQETSAADLDALLQQHPDDVVVRQRLAQRLEKEGAHAKAAALWEEAFNLNPKLPVISLQLAKLYAGPLQNPGKAMEYAAKARALDPNDPETAKLAGQAAYRTGNYPWAYGLLQSSARAFPTEPGILRDLAWCAYDLGKVEDARQSMQHALEMAPDSPEADQEKTFLQLTEPMPKPEATAENAVLAKSTLAKDPTNVPALMLRGESQVHQHQMDAAIETYKSILAQLPDFGLAQKKLAALYLDRPDQAPAAFELAAKARQSLPDDPEAAQILAVARYGRKEYRAVLQLLAESAPKRTLDAQLLFYQGMSRLQLKQTEEGIKSLNQSLASGLTGPSAEQARRAMASEAKP